MIKHTMLNYDGFLFFYREDLKVLPEDFSKHCHNAYEIIYIKEGLGYFYVEGNKYKIKNNVLLFFRPQEFHFINIAPETKYSRFVLNFDDSAVLDQKQSLLEIFNNRVLGFNNMILDEDKTLYNILSRLKGYLGLSDADRIMLSKLLLNELLIILKNKYNLKIYNISNEKLIIRIINYINENLSSQIKLDKLSEEFHISKYYLQHLFKKETGVPIMKYIVHKRILKVQSLVADGYKLSSAATLCGFNDYSSFYRTYVKHIGKKPSEITQ